MEDILDAKMNLSYKDYVVTPDDYFRVDSEKGIKGCPTMFKSEKAALAACRTIW
jgi:hypothetical protein